MTQFFVTNNCLMFITLLKVGWISTPVGQLGIFLDVGLSRVKHRRVRSFFFYAFYIFTLYYTITAASCPQSKPLDWAVFESRTMKELIQCSHVDTYMYNYPEVFN